MLQLDERANAYLEQLSKTLANELSGSEITRFFQFFRLSDQLGERATKYKRIFNAFCDEINSTHNDSKVIKFIEETYNPIRFNGDSSRFHNAKEEINKVLLFMGCELNDSGKVTSVTKANTIDEVNARINKLSHELSIRNIHPSIMKYCSKEYLVNDYFHACFEAVKGTFQRIRDITNLNTDGNLLLDSVFSKEKPLLVINSMKTVTEKDEFQGLKNLLLFLHKSVRNYDAHETRLNHEIELDKALDIFVSISMANKYLDNAHPTCFVQN